MLMLKTHERAPPHEQAETSHLHTSDRQREFCESDSDTHEREVKGYENILALGPVASVYLLWSASHGIKDTYINDF